MEFATVGTGRGGRSLVPRISERWQPHVRKLLNGVPRRSAEPSGTAVAAVIAADVARRLSALRELLLFQAYCKLHGEIGDDAATQEEARLLQARYTAALHTVADI